MTARGSRWVREVFSRIVTIINEANRGAWPGTLDEWLRVTRLIGVTVLCVKRPQFDGELRDDTIIVAWADDIQLLIRRIVHEIAERILAWEGAEPYHYPATAYLEDDRHLIACHVERYALSHI